jgi:hypothetical protein
LTGGGSLESNRTISHADTSTQSSVNNSGSNFIQDITLDEYGHVTAIGSATIPAIGEGQTWQAVTIISGATNRNLTGRPIMVAGECRWQSSDGFQVSTDGTNWLTLLDSTENDQSNPFSIIIPNLLYYRINGTIIRVNELR